MDKFKDLKNFTYPNLSYIFYVLLMTMCLVYDNNDFLIWILTFVLMVLLYNSPVYNVYVRDLVDFLKITAKKNRLD
jgi:c-di-AMP phosphodiesterase-like protein